jgi:hypothetical protein
MSDVYWYCAPLIPIVIRLLLVARYRSLLKMPLSGAEADTESHRTVVVALAGFSFTGLIGLIVANAATRTSYKLAIYFLLTSFLCYLFALNLQGYKLWRWIDILSDTAWETASLSLILAIIQTMRAALLGSYFVAGATIMAALIWGADFIARIVLLYTYLARMGEQNVRRQKEPVAAAKKPRPR